MVNPIMTTTLPTIIGAGVVSRTTETMFGRGKGRGKKGRTTKATRTVKVYRGPRGGHYVVRRGRKIYL